MQREEWDDDDWDMSDEDIEAKTGDSDEFLQWCDDEPHCPNCKEQMQKFRGEYVCPYCGDF